MAKPTGPKQEFNDSATRIAVYSPTGYHGDPNIMRVVDWLVIGCSQFVETGTEAGSTVGYTARMYPHLECYTTEMDKGTFEAAAKHLSNHTNIHQSNMHSLEWLPSIMHSEMPALFWLDAHSHGWGCVLGKEVAIILDKWQGGYILLDDFEVPGREDFGFDWYASSGKLNWETVELDLMAYQIAKIKGMYYPNYKSPYGTRGWLLIHFGNAPDWKMPSFVTKA